MNPFSTDKKAIFRRRTRTPAAPAEPGGATPTRLIHGLAHARRPPDRTPSNPTGPSPSPSSSSSSPPETRAGHSTAAESSTSHPLRPHPRDPQQQYKTRKQILLLLLLLLRLINRTTRCGGGEEQPTTRRGDPTNHWSSATGELCLLRQSIQPELRNLLIARRSARLIVFVFCPVQPCSPPSRGSWRQNPPFRSQVNPPWLLADPVGFDVSLSPWTDS
jgi:hypothetical protein